MNRVLCVTIDVEPDCDTQWRRSEPLGFESVLYGIGNLLRPIWDRYEIRPVYFVSPEVLEVDACCEALKKEIAAGAEIGAHLHSEYIEPAKKYELAAGTSSSEYPCFAHSREVEKAKIANLTELIVKRFGVKPISYRAARFGADLETIRSLEALGYRVDSSVTPQIDWSCQGGPDHSRAPFQPYFISGDNYYSQGNSRILEVPISISKKRVPIFSDRWLFYRWLRPTHMTVVEMKILANEFTDRYDEPVLNMMFHSMELIPRKTPYVRTVVEQKMYLGRLKRIIRYLREEGFRGKTLRELYNEKLREIS